MLCFKDKEFDEKVLAFCKDKASDESYNILREKVYKENFSY